MGTGFPSPHLLHARTQQNTNREKQESAAQNTQQSVLSAVEEINTLHPPSMQSEEARRVFPVVLYGSNISPVAHYLPLSYSVFSMYRLSHQQKS